MKDTRSASQILFGFLPEQTVDVKGGIWKVKNWNTVAVHDVDTEKLVLALIANAAPWESEGKDGGYVGNLRRGRTVRVEELDREKGIRLEVFPCVWKCDNCNRLHEGPHANCDCGNSHHGQLPFVLIHDACGGIKQPFYPRCQTHGQAKMELPGTTNLYEIRLSCPICNVDLLNHFLQTKCNCGVMGRRGLVMDFNVHRGAMVYTPRNIVIVNPPSKNQKRKLQTAGGPPTALIWLASGMDAEWIDDIEGGRAAVLRRNLIEYGLARNVIEQMMKDSRLPDEPAANVVGPAAVIAQAEKEATEIALAMSETRQTITHLAASAGGQNAELYTNKYSEALKTAGLQRVDLVERFPVLMGQYGYTRGDHEPGESRLRTFTQYDGSYIVYGQLTTTEALIIRLNPCRVARWLVQNGYVIETPDEPRAAYEAVLEGIGPNIGFSPVKEEIERLIHSYSHCMIRQASFYAGIDRNALSELLFPVALTFVTFATPRGDFVLGGLQAMFEHDLHTVLNQVVHNDSRCPLDPGCAANPSGAACAVCLHLGEPSCRLYNTKLDREILFGQRGYFSIND